MNKKEKSAFDNEMYEAMLQKLQEEKGRLEREIKKEYRNARKYIRANPEEGVVYSFVGGIVVGILLAKIFQR